jgi:hypothetical protein
VTFLEIVNRVRQNCGISGADLSTVTGATGESLRIINWVNESWLDIQSMRPNWHWMRRSVAFPLVAGQATYTTAQTGVTDFGHWLRDSFRNYINPIITLTIASPCVLSLTDNNLSAGDTVKLSTTGTLPTGLTAGVTYYVVNPTTDTFQLSLTAGGVAIDTTGTQSGTHTITSSNTSAFAGLRSEMFMQYMEYETYRNAYQYANRRVDESRPYVISVTPAKSLAMGPGPAAGYTVVGDYFSTPSEMVLSADVPALPIKFHLAIVYATMVRYGMFESAQEVVQQGQAEYAKWKSRILFDQMPDVVLNEPLA